MSTMLSPNALQTPKSGRSRFSKALPAVPDLYAPSPLPSPPKDLTELPPPPPPPRSDSIAASPRPVTPSRPQLRPVATTSTASSGSPRMAIPRKPVAKSSSQPPSQPPSQLLPQQPTAQQMQMQAQTQSTVAAQYKEMPLPPAPEIVSPSESLSSLLSAYSWSSGESLTRSSDEVGSVRESEAKYSLHNDPSVSAERKDSSTSSTTTTTTTSTPKANDLPQTQNGAQKPIEVDGNLPPPPPPSKDDKYHLPKSPAPIRSANQEAVSPSSPKSQIWRRRSVKGERSLELPDLNLVSSHGSTASTQPSAQSIQSQQPSGALKVSPLPLQPPRSAIGGLPGRNIRPVPSQERVAENQAMGSDISKLKKLKGNLPLSNHNTGATSSSTKSDTTIRLTAQRPPTPEYQKEDVRTPIIETFISPVSPASSPEPPSKEVSPDFPKNPPQEPAAVVEVKPVARKAVPAPAPQQDITTTQVPGVTVTPQTPETSQQGSFAVQDIANNRESGGNDAASSRTHQSFDSARFPPRTSSTKQDGPRPVEQAARPPPPATEPDPRADPRFAPSDSQGPVYRGRDGTLYPEMKVLQEPHPQASYFPKQSEEPIPEGTIIKAPPLKSSHYNCYQNHRSMIRRGNKYYPLTCQTCEKPDAEDRWACTFCHLRICETCLKTLNEKQRDLRRLVEGVKPSS